MLRVLFFIASFHSVLYAQNSLAKDSLHAKDLFNQGCNQILSEHFGESLNTFQELLAFQEQKFPTFEKTYPPFLDRNLARFYSGIGYLRISKFKTALEIFTSHLDNLNQNPKYIHDDKWGDQKQKCIAYIAESYQDLGLYDIAVIYYLDAEKVAKTLPDSLQQAGLALIYTNLAGTYRKTNNWEEAIKLDYRSLLIDKKQANNQQYLAIDYLNLGYDYLESKKLDSANFYLQKVFSLIKPTDYALIYANTLFRYGQLLAQKGDHRIAIDTLLQAEKWVKNTGQKSIYAQISTAISQSYLRGKQFDLALQYVQQALMYCDETHSPLDRLIALRTKAKVEQSLGKSQDALISIQEVVRLDSSINNLKRLNYIDGMAIHLEVKKKETKLALSQQEVTAKKKQLWVSWLIAILLILLLLALYYTYKSSKKAYRAESEKFEMERRAHQAEAIKAAILESELVAKELAYESLQTELSELQMQLQPPINHSPSTDIPLSKSTHHFDFAIDKIIYCQGGADNYVDIFVFPNKKYTERITLKKLEAILPPQKFRRVHKSYIINFDFLEKEKNDVFIMKTGESIPRSRNR